MSATLSLNNISMTYYTKTDETKAIDNLSFDVNKGGRISTGYARGRIQRRGLDNADE